MLGDLTFKQLNPLNTKLNPIYHLLALLGAHHILHISRIRVKFVYVNACKKTPLQIHFKYLDKEIYCTFMTCCIIFILFPIQYCLFYNVIIFCSNNKFCKQNAEMLNTHLVI
jgi:hypothetical protein